MTGTPELPEDLAEVIRQDWSGTSDFNRRVFMVGLRCCGLGISEDDAVDLIADHVLDFPRKDLTYQVTRTVAAAYEKYDPALAAGGLVARLTALQKRVEQSELFAPADRACIVALIQRAINVGIHPIAASSHELAAVSGYGAWSMAQAMRRLAASGGHGVLLGCSWDGIVGHTRVWTLDLDWHSTDQTPHTYLLAASNEICDKRSLEVLTAVGATSQSADDIRQISGASRKDTRAAIAELVDEGRLVKVKGAGKVRTVRYAHNLLADGAVALAEAAPVRKPTKLKPDVSKFVEYIESFPIPEKADGTGAKFTAPEVAQALGVSHAVAYGWLSDYQDEFFGGGCYEGSRRDRRPAAWWRGPKPAMAESPEVRRDRRLKEQDAMRAARKRTQ